MKLWCAAAPNLTSEITGALNQWVQHTLAKALQTLLLFKKTYFTLSEISNAAGQFLDGTDLRRRLNSCNCRGAVAKTKQTRRCIALI